MLYTSKNLSDHTDYRFETEKFVIFGKYNFGTFLKPKKNSTIIFFVEKNKDHKK